MGIQIDDLHAVVSENPKELPDSDDTHPSPLGVAVCAKHVAESIRAANNTCQ